MGQRDVLLPVWQARRESNPQPAVLETAALPIELLAFIVIPKLKAFFQPLQQTISLKTTKPRGLKDPSA
jgi:hypothetical protein